ncbi:MAG: zinc-ribbon domain-containing protein [Candidatus Hermodarchaeota archaeon]
MFCPNCGEKLDSPNQRFCSRCGSELQSTPFFDTPQEPVNQVQVSTVQSVPVYETKPIKTGGPGSYSKKVFAFAFLSLVLAGIGFSLDMISFLRFVIPIYVFPRLPSGPIVLIAAMIIHFIGVIFGVVAKANSTKARKYEMENTLERVGKIFGILGIIVNMIPLVVINIGLVIINVPFSPPPGPMYP